MCVRRDDFHHTDVLSDQLHAQRGAEAMHCGLGGAITWKPRRGDDGEAGRDGRNDARLALGLRRGSKFQLRKTKIAPNEPRA